MKRYTTILLLLLSSLAVFGQKNINNELTSGHENIVGTKLSLVPPKGFVRAKNFFGLEQEETVSSIMVVDIPGPYSEVSKGISKSSLATKGIDVKKIVDLRLNGLPGMLVSGSQDAYGSTFTKFMLIFGTEEESFVINGACPNALKEVGAGIKAAMLSVCYEAEREIDPLEVVNFVIDVSGTKLKLGKSMAKSLLFSVDGAIPTQSEDKTNLLVGQSFSEVEHEDKKAFCTDRLNQLPLELETIEYTRELSIGGLPGCEIFAKGKSSRDGSPEYVYQVILFNDMVYYILLGTTNDGSGESLEQIKQAIQTFRLK